jgi:endonuclease/exonuclease/phosphatase family metal-dependent hydrolase
MSLSRRHPFWLALLVSAGIAGCDQKPAPSPAPAPAPAPGAPADTKPVAPAASTTAAADRPRADQRIGVPDPLPRTPGAIRVATYNLENLFDDKDDPAYSGRNDDADDTKPADQLKALADTIRRLDADVLAVEEVESLDVIRAFRDTYLADMGYAHLVSLDSGDERGIEQAVLSRFPLENPQVWPELPLGGIHPDKFGDEPNYFAGKPITYKRSPLRVDVVVPPQAGATTPYRLTLFVVHHKSGRGGAYWRERESTKAVELIREIEAATPFEDNVIVLGDFNAQPAEPSVKTYFDAGFNSAATIARKDPAVKARGWNEASWTTHASGRTIDLILLNPGVAKEFVPTSTFVLSTPQRPRGSDWRTTKPPAGYGSDHLPVAIDLIPRD